MGFIFLAESQAAGLQIYLKCIPQKVFSKVFAQICCYLSNFEDIFGKYIS